MKIRKRRRPLTLLEVGIAIFLTGILLSFLWNLYDRWNRTLFELQKEKHLLLQKILIQEKFSKIFSHLCPQEIEQKQQRVFYTAPLGEEAKEGLIFSYEAGIDPDPAYSGTLFGGIYLSPNKELWLISWSKGGLPRKETLLEKVTACSFDFFDAKKKEWRGSWPKKLERLPTMIKIKVASESDAQEMSYSFFVFDTVDPILYDGSKRHS